jgi:hypothetical protein
MGHDVAMLTPQIARPVGRDRNVDLINKPMHDPSRNMRRANKRAMAASGRAHAKTWDNKINTHIYLICGSKSISIR